MKVFTCSTFDGYYPVGAAAVVVAGNAMDAARILEEELSKIGLDQTVNHNNMTELNTSDLNCVILQDGNY